VDLGGVPENCRQYAKPSTCNTHISIAEATADDHNNVLQHVGKAVMQKVKT